MTKASKRVYVRGLLKMDVPLKKKKAKIKSTKKKSTKSRKKKAVKKLKTPVAPKGKKKGAVKSKSKPRRNRVMSVYEVPVDVDVVVVPKVRLRVGMRMPDGSIVPLYPVPAEKPKTEEKVAAEDAGKTD